jgi:twitching motility protein PilT
MPDFSEEQQEKRDKQKPTPFALIDLLTYAVKLNASDIHLTAGLPPILRISKNLVPVEISVLTSDMIEQLIFPIITPKQREAFETNLDLDFSYDVPLLSRFRVNIFRQNGTTAVAMRRIAHKIPELNALGLPPVVKTFTQLDHGFVLVTGPTGSGKTTTLAAIINEINKTRQVHIITIEDPIEYVFHHEKSVVQQREYGMDTNDFAGALRSCLREDPDVILLGEMRDLATISAALTAAETGHLVFATLHTNSAPQTIDRMIDAFPSEQQQQVRIQLADVITAVLSQQLVPRLDGNGIVLAAEVMLSTMAVKNLIREQKTFQLNTIIESNTDMGMTTMDNSLTELCRRELISYECAIDHAFDKKVVAGNLQRIRSYIH